MKTGRPIKGGFHAVNFSKMVCNHWPPKSKSARKISALNILNTIEIVAAQGKVELAAFFSSVGRIIAKGPESYSLMDYHVPQVASGLVKAKSTVNLEDLSSAAYRSSGVNISPRSIVRKNIVRSRKA